MPAKSRAQQRLMQAAEHGATFPLAQQLRDQMTHAQLHDFAAGSEQGKPQHVATPMHPRMQARATAVKAAHAHLSKTQPGFRQMRPADQFRHTQAHVKKQGY